jgi:arginine utilization protein RocB
VLTFTTGPGELLEKLRARTEAALARVLSQLDEAEARWQQSLAVEGVPPQRPPARTPAAPRAGIVLTYAELYQRTADRLGAERVRRELADEAASLPAGIDARERSLRLVQRLWTLSGESGPAVVLSFAPPYYPHAAASVGPLLDAVQSVVHTHPEAPLTIEEFYPYISDMSYLRLEPGVDLTALEANLPQWSRLGEPPLPGAYSLPLDAIRELDMPFVDLGPFGGGVHQRGEWALASYSFGVVPQLVYEVIAQLASD